MLRHDTHCCVSLFSGTHLVTLVRLRHLCDDVTDGKEHASVTILSERQIDKRFKVVQCLDNYLHIYVKSD